MKIRFTDNYRGESVNKDLPYWLGMTSGSVSSPSGGSWSLIIWWCRVSLLFTPVQLFPIDVARLLNCGDVVRVCCCFCSIWQSTAIVGSWVCLFDFKFSSTLLRNRREKKKMHNEYAKINLFYYENQNQSEKKTVVPTCWLVSGTPLPIQYKRWRIKLQRLTLDRPALVKLECSSNSIDLKTVKWK